MVVDRVSAEVRAGWFRGLGDASRVRILNRLAVARQPMSVGEMVDAVDVGHTDVEHVEILDDAEHLLMEDQPDRVTEILTQFLTRPAPADPAPSGSARP